MNIPGFTAEVSIGPTTSIYRGKAVFGRSALDAGRTAFAAQALRGSMARQSDSSTGTLRAIGGGGGSSFVCSSNFCTCRGADDCLDLWFNTNLCSDPSHIYCPPDYSYCICHR
jgi:hypothetical protein